MEKEALAQWCCYCRVRNRHSTANLWANVELGRARGEGAGEGVGGGFKQMTTRSARTAADDVIFGLNAAAFRSSVDTIALFLSLSVATVFMQFRHLQLGWQYSPLR